MANISKEYWPFYLQGRDAKRIRQRDFDVEAVADSIVQNGTPVREAIYAACVEIYKPYADGRAKRKWLEEPSVQAALGDLPGPALHSDPAYAAYHQGLVDELAYAMEQNVLDAMEEGDEDDGEEGEDEGDDDEEDEDEDD